jgi:hypothetical protein
MREVTLTPGVELMESLRAVGYSSEAAVADIVDNSVSAGASRISIAAGFGDDHWVSILDDGRGMTLEQAKAAMRLAGTVNTERKPGDLGRFGLGMKTASISQCRQLTVVSKTGDGVIAVRWDLDHLAKASTWSLQILAADEIAMLPGVTGLQAQATGTLILWRVLDRLVGGVLGDRSLVTKLTEIADHLELTFHRFIAGAASPKIEILVGSRALVALDPFLEDHRATQRLPSEELNLQGEVVKVRPFILPHIGKLTSRDKSRAMITEGMRESQGFYVYRNNRLIDRGTWFKLAPVSELSKLARVAVEFESSGDQTWALDVKKSRAVPPEVIRRELRRVIDRITGSSRSVHLFRGRPESDPDAGSRVWTLHRGRDSFSYGVNRDHPLVSSAVESGAPVEQLLRALESTFPIADLYNRLSASADVVANDVPTVELVRMARIIWLAERPTDFEAFATAIALVEPFSLHPESRALLSEERERIVNGDD